MLIDTNIIIEIGRQQDRAEECQLLLDAINQEIVGEKVYMTKFSLSAVQALLTPISPQLVKEILVMIYQEKINLVKMEVSDELMIISSMKELGLDFDDATQFLAANKVKSYIVSYDKDFDKTDYPRKEPKDILKELIIDYKVD